MTFSLSKSIKSFGAPRISIIALVIVLFFMAFAKNMSMSGLMTDSIARMMRNGILVLALLPGIRGGITLNFGLPLGILCGLLGTMICLEFNVVGIQGFLLTLSLAVFFASIVGFIYGRFLNAVRGQEMTVGTYVGFAVVSLMCVVWLVLPFHNPKLIWAIGGKGLRITIPLNDYYLQILDNFLGFSIYGVKFPTGAILFFALCCALVHLFFNTKVGTAITAAGSNEKFARASGINPDRTRIMATMLSTVLAAVGIVVYSQSFGFVQLYTAPLLMAFPIIACILIGGADLQNATIFHVVFGTIVFQTLLTIALPVTSEYIGGDISEVARIIISNGIILYALTGVKK